MMKADSVYCNTCLMAIKLNSKFQARMSNHFTRATGLYYIYSYYMISYTATEGSKCLFEQELTRNVLLDITIYMYLLLYQKSWQKKWIEVSKLLWQNNLTLSYKFVKDAKVVVFGELYDWLISQWLLFYIYYFWISSNILIIIKTNLLFRL